MGVDIGGTTEIDARIEQVWMAIHDPVVLARCIPGCQSLERRVDGEFLGVVALRIGPVKASFSGVVTISDAIAPSSCVLIGHGQGGVAGFAKGRAQVRLVEVGPGRTLLSYTATAEIGGKMAQLGNRLILSAVRKLSDQFFAAFAAEFSKAEPAS